MSPILMDAVTKARRSPNAPKTKAQAQRRLARYQRLAQAAGDKPTGRIASAEAQRLQGVISGGKYGRGGTDGRTELERQRTAERKRTDRNNDGWIDGQKPKGAKPRKTATKAPTKTEAAMQRLQDARALLASMKDSRFSVHTNGARIEIGFAYNRADVDAIKAIPGAKYDPSTKRWSISTRQADKLAELLEQRRRSASAAAVAPKAVMRAVTGDTFAVRDKLKAMGGKWDGQSKSWSVPADKWEEAQRIAKPAPRAAPTYTPKEAPKRSWSEREMFPLDKLPSVGSTIRDGSRILYVEGHGKVFRISDDASSMGNRYVIGREGDRAAYAYLKPATPEQAAAHEKGERRQRRNAKVSAGRKTIMSNVERLAQQNGDRPPLDTMPDGDWIVPIDPSKSLYGYGSGLLLDRDGKTLWHVKRNGADGDDWSRNNAPGSIVTRLVLPPDHLRRVQRAFRIKKSIRAAIRKAIRKALIRPGKPPLHRRLGFLLSSANSDRAFRIGQYLESRKAGKGFGPAGKRRRRKGTYTGVYATGVNKANRKVRKDAMSPILSEAVAKAARSLSAPKSKKQAKRRAALYDRAAQSGRGPVARIAAAEAARQRSFAETGKYGRGMTEGRAGEEKYRADGAYRQDVRNEGRKRRNDKNNDGWVDGQKPKGAKPRKTAEQARLQGSPAAGPSRERKPSNFRIDESVRDPDGLTPNQRSFLERRKAQAQSAYDEAVARPGGNRFVLPTGDDRFKRDLEDIRSRPDKNRNKKWREDTQAMQVGMATAKPGAPWKSQWYRPDRITGSQSGAFGRDGNLRDWDRGAMAAAETDAASGAFKPGDRKGHALYSYERAWATARARQRVRKAIRKAIRALAA